MNQLLKSSPPISRPTTGMMRSFTSESTILPKAVPMITPTARSTTLPLTANSRNSLTMLIRSPLSLDFPIAHFDDFQLFLAGRRAQRHDVACAPLEQRLGDRRDPRDVPF